MVVIGTNAYLFITFFCHIASTFMDLCSDFHTAAVVKESPQYVGCHTFDTDEVETT